MTTRKELYQRVNDALPLDVKKPLSNEESIRAAKKLYRFGLKRAWTGPVVITSGRNYTYVRGGVLRVNPNQCGGGLSELIHSMSHYVHNRLHPDLAPHDKKHARLELRMRKQVAKRGWLLGSLKTNVAQQEPLAKSASATALVNGADKPGEKGITSASATPINRTAALIKRWESKLKRATNALKKLRRRQAAQQRAELKRAAAGEVAASPATTIQVAAPAL